MQARRTDLELAHLEHEMRCRDNLSASHTDPSPRPHLPPSMGLHCCVHAVLCYAGSARTVSCAASLCPNARCTDGQTLPRTAPVLRWPAGPNAAPLRATAGRVLRLT